MWLKLGLNFPIDVIVLILSFLSLWGPVYGAIIGIVNVRWRSPLFVNSRHESWPGEFDKNDNNKWDKKEREREKSGHGERPGKMNFVPRIRGFH